MDGKEFLLPKEGVKKHMLCRASSASPASKFSLIHEAEVNVCRLFHNKTLIQKIISSKHLRRWETHKIVLDEICLHSKTPKGFMAHGLDYTEIKDVVICNKKSSHIIHISIPSSGSLLIQTNSIYQSHCWLNSILWKIVTIRFQKLITLPPDDLCKELKELVTFCMETPLTDPIIYQYPLTTVSNILMHNCSEITDSLREKCITIIAPILKITAIPASICKCFQRVTRLHPTVEVKETLSPIIENLIKHNTDFGKFPHLRIFIQDYLCYIYLHKKSTDAIVDFIDSLHTSNANCPHPRVIANIVTVALAATYSAFETEKEEHTCNSLKETILTCFEVVFDCICKYDDWIPSIAIFLQAVPFPHELFKEKNFSELLRRTIKLIAFDRRCEVHQLVLPIKDEKIGWAQLVAPGGELSPDEGELFCFMLEHLLQCCLKRKPIITSIKNNLKGLILSLAKQGNKTCIEVLIALIEISIDEDEKLEIMSALQCSPEGQQQAINFLKKRSDIEKLKTCGGPYKLALPSQSTDEDLIHVLRSGKYGNIKSLNLAFTKVTSEAAKHIIKLPSLTDLNLWSTPFGDKGLQLLTEHLPNLECLNLCETCVTDDGLKSLVYLERLRYINMNSTSLSNVTYDLLKEKLTNLRIVDVCYTDVW